MDIQYSLFDEQLPFEEGTEYTANQITDKIKWYYNNKPFYAMNNTKETTDRIYFCDFKPRNRYIYNGKWRKIKNKRERTLASIAPADSENDLVEYKTYQWGPEQLLATAMDEFQNKRFVNYYNPLMGYKWGYNSKFDLCYTPIKITV